MIVRKSLIVFLLTILAMVPAARSALGAVSPQEAAQLGKNLTLFGAQKAGSKDGIIPPYTGGLTTPPPGFKAGSGVYPDPFPNDKPLFTIDAHNMNKYADKLTEGTKAMMKLYPGFHINVYRTRRTVAYPKFVLDNTLRNAVTAKTTDGGLDLVGAHAGIPFPIPKTGMEVMWNHLTRYEGRASKFFSNVYTVDSSGRRMLAASATCWEDYPYYDVNAKNAELYYQIRCDYKAPARMSGEILELQDPLNPAKHGRKAWEYLPGLRRVKLAPELAFDTPNPNGGGVTTFDDLFLFCGSMERYNWKLIGKKEIYVPYNVYKLQLANRKVLFGKHFLNPDLVRWELHRVWVVEADLKPGYRHIYHKRRFYIDEDSWAALATESYDARGDLYKFGTASEMPLYDQPAPLALTQVFYDLISGNYVVNSWLGDSPEYKGYFRTISPPPARFWSPEGIAGSGIR